MKRLDLLIYTLLALVLVIIAIGYHDQSIHCTARHGVLVRTVFGTACVQGMKE